MRKKNPPKLKVFEDRILQTMRMYYEPMTINDVSERSGIHWLTAKKHILSLKRKGHIEEVTLEGRKFWQATQQQTN